MTFQPGQSGNPKGRTSEKEFRRALMLELRQADGDHDKLRKVAQSVVEAAIEGDMRAANLIADRIDGKPAQAVTLSGDDDNPIQHNHAIVDEFIGRISGIAARNGAGKVNGKSNGHTGA